MDWFMVANTFCYVKIFQKSRTMPALCVLTLSLLLATCAIMIGVSALVLNDQDFLVEFQPTREYKSLLIDFLTITACVAFVTGLWGIGTFKVEGQLFVGILSLALVLLVIILTAFVAIFGSLATTPADILYAVCKGGNANTLAVANVQFEPLEDIENAVSEYDRI